MLPHKFGHFSPTPTPESGRPTNPALFDLFLQHALVSGSEQNLVYLLCSPLLGQVVQSTNYLTCSGSHEGVVEEFISW